VLKEAFRVLKPGGGNDQTAVTWSAGCVNGKTSAMVGFAVADV